MILPWLLRSSNERATRKFVRINERRYEKLQFVYSADGETWTDVGPVLDATKLSDEYANDCTGAFFGLCAQDLNGQRAHTDFDWFEYQENA